MERQAVKRIRGLGFAVCCFAIAWHLGFAHSPDSAVEQIRDARGLAVAFSGAPKRIVSLSPAITEMLFALGAGKAVVGDTSFCNYPGEAQKKPKVGDVTTNIEAVVALKPDLVLAHKTMNAQAVVRLEKLGLRVFCLAPESFAQLREQMALLGRVLKREEEARSWQKRFDGRVKGLQKRLVGRRKVTCALVVQVNPLWVAGRECFLDEIIRLAGGINVCAQEVRVSAPLDGERLVALNPRVVLGVNPATGDLRRGFWKQLGAVKDRSVYAVPADLISRPGPRMIEAAERVADILDKYRS